VLLPPPSLGIPQEAWEQFPPAAQSIIIGLEARIRELEEKNGKHEERIRDLEARLKQNSSNSSKPPSSDSFKKHAKKKKPSGNPPGAQPGHQGHCRPLVPVEDVDEIVDHSPGTCEHCGEILGIDDAVGAPERHQVSELPQMKPRITEHQACNRRCKRCGNTTRGFIPAATKQSAFGPRIHALASLFTARYQLSRSDATECFEQIFGLPISRGGIQRLIESVAQALEPAYADALEALRLASVRYFDETSWPVKGKRRWMWIGVTVRATVFRINPSRGKIVLREWIGKEAISVGHAVSDRYAAYNVFDMKRRGICWAHLGRDFQKMKDCGDPFMSVIGMRAVHLHEDYFALRKRREIEEITHDEFLALAKSIEQELRAVLDRGSRASHKLSGMCTNILKHWAAVWNHVRIPGMEPTNNAAERGLRPAVIWRKLTFGTRSAAGSVVVERMLTVLETCKQNTINFYEFITQTVNATFQGNSVPSLIPASSAGINSS